MRRRLVSFRRELDNAKNVLFPPKSMHRTIFAEESFHRMISLERRRAKRSQKSFLLMLLDVGEHSTSRHNTAALRKVLSALSGVLRDTDLTGWYKENSVIGVMFTEINCDNQNSVPATIMARVTKTLKDCLTPQQLHQSGFSFHLLPEVREPELTAPASHPALYQTAAAPSGATESSL
jgi:hypothetical protein